MSHNKIFIDAGANNGRSVKFFRRNFDPQIEFFVYSFEIEPTFKNKFNKFSNLEFINKAVWIRNGISYFFRDFERLRDGGTLLKNKKTGKLDKKHPIQVETIDFSDWLKNNFTKEQCVFLKLDIEGAEYDVLEKMHKDGTIDLINTFFVEWHWHKVGIDKKRHEFIESLIKDNKPWFSHKGKRCRMPKSYQYSKISFL
jgi:FkbM family methyltransferase